MYVWRVVAALLGDHASRRIGGPLMFVGVILLLPVCFAVWAMWIR